MTLSVWLTLASSLGAMMAAMISLLTLFELFRQRKASYKPDLCVLKTHFTVKDSEVGKFKIPTDWFKHDSEVKNSVFVQLVNIGFGAAKQIKAEWIFDPLKLIKEINQLAQENGDIFHLKDDGNFISIESQNIVFFMTNSNMKLFSFDYSLPSSQDPQGLTLYLPPSYGLLIALYIGLYVKVKKSLPCSELIKIELKLEYIDIGKNKHSSKHIVQAELGSLSMLTGSIEMRVSLVECL